MRGGGGAFCASGAGFAGRIAFDEVQALGQALGLALACGQRREASLNRLRAEIHRRKEVRRGWMVRMRRRVSGFRASGHSRSRRGSAIWLGIVVEDSLSAGT
jgi:hypothetical protein